MEQPCTTLLEIAEQVVRAEILIPIQECNSIKLGFLRKTVWYLLGSSGTISRDVSDKMVKKSGLVTIC